MDEYWRSKTIQLMRIPQTHPKNVKSAFRLFFEETVYKRFFFDGISSNRFRELARRWRVGCAKLCGQARFANRSIFHGF